jgi:hypothetical protein
LKGKAQWNRQSWGDLIGPSKNFFNRFNFLFFTREAIDTCSREKSMDPGYRKNAWASQKKHPYASYRKTSHIGLDDLPSYKEPARLCVYAPIKPNYRYS